jgi:hypothetical protein
MYLQRLSWDRKRGVIITKHRIGGSVTIWPKGLRPDERYRVDFQEDAETWEASGEQLMREGITLTGPAPGEIIYLNLPDHPGNRIDTAAPTAPAQATCREARFMGVPGVAIRWKPARDDRWLSFYEVYRDGERLDRVAKGCFYFDHSAGADPAARYQVRAVDGAGNRSEFAEAKGAAKWRRQVIDDAETAALEYAGDWKREAGFAPTYRGTLSSAESAGASFTVRFRGRGVVWSGFLGITGGLARVTVDDEPPVTVSCYGADEIPGWPLFERVWSTPGEHRLKVEALGQPDPRGRGAHIWLDGIAITP